MNSDKRHLLVVGHKFDQIWAKIGTDLIWESNSVKLLGITIDNHLKFDKCISLLCIKANRKLFALARISNYLTFHQKRTLIKAFFESQFRYWSLTWMFHSRKSNNKINLLHERALRMIYNDKFHYFRNFLIKIIPLLFVILISSHLPLKCLTLSIKQLQPLQTIYSPHIIVTIFAQNLSLLFQVVVHLITAKILYSITVPLPGI